MTNFEFALWLCGFVLLEQNNKTLTSQQVLVILNHLNLAKEVDGKLDNLNSWLFETIHQLIKQNTWTQDLLSTFTQQVKTKYESVLKHKMMAKAS